jgi:hypothetical protein
MLLGLPPARYVVLPHYEPKLKTLLETANDMDGSLPLEYEVTTLEVRQAIRTLQHPREVSTGCNAAAVSLEIASWRRCMCKQKVLRMFSCRFVVLSMCRRARSWSCPRASGCAPSRPCTRFPHR